MQKLPKEACASHKSMPFQGFNCRLLIHPVVGTHHTWSPLTGAAHCGENIWTVRLYTHRCVFRLIDFKSASHQPHPWLELNIRSFKFSAPDGAKTQTLEKLESNQSWPTLGLIDVYPNQQEHEAVDCELISHVFVPLQDMGLSDFNANNIEITLTNFSNT